MKDRCLFSLKSLYIVYMYISTMATVAPCVSKSAAAILTCMKGACFLLRSSVVIFRIIHICQHKGMGHEVKLLVNLQKTPLYLMNSRDINNFLSSLFLTLTLYNKICLDIWLVKFWTSLPDPVIFFFFLVDGLMLTEQYIGNFGARIKYLGHG